MKKEKKNIKKINFVSGKLTMGSLGAAMSGLIKTDLVKLCKDINESPNCKLFPEQTLTVHLIITNVVKYTISTPSTINLIKSKANGKQITLNDIEEIAKIKLPSLNTNLFSSAINTIIATAKSGGFQIL